MGYIWRANKSRLGRVALAIAGWTLLGCIFALPGLAAGDRWREALLEPISEWWSWGLLTPVIFWADRRMPFSGKQLGRRISAHLLPSLFATSVYIYIHSAIGAAFGIREWNTVFSAGIMIGALRGMFVWDWLNYWLILGAWQVYLYYGHYLAGELRLERLEKSFSEARLNALRMQLDPHFLFNALNTISSQVERDPKLARAMIEHLGNLLRLSLESKDRQEVPLAEEMAFLEHYLAIQKIRFDDHLRIEIDIAPEVKYASVPCLFVQPLVENAIRHGISRRASGGTVIVSARKNGSRLELRVLDDGVGLPPGWTLESCGGVGLSVTRQRIAGLYPDVESCFAVKPRATGGTEVEISLPLRWTGNEAHAVQHA